MDANSATHVTQVSLHELAIIIIEGMTGTRRAEGVDAVEAIEAMLLAPVTNLYAIRALNSARDVVKYIQECNSTSHAMHALGIPLSKDASR